MCNTHFSCYDSIELFTTAISNNSDNVRYSDKYTQHQKDMFNFLIECGRSCIKNGDFINLRIVSHKLNCPDGYLSNFA